MNTPENPRVDCSDQENIDMEHAHEKSDSGHDQGRPPAETPLIAHLHVLELFELLFQFGIHSLSPFDMGTLVFRHQPFRYLQPFLPEVSYCPGVERNRTEQYAVHPGLFCRGMSRSDDGNVLEVLLVHLVNEITGKALMDRIKTAEDAGLDVFIFVGLVGPFGDKCEGDKGILFLELGGPFQVL